MAMRSLGLIFVVLGIVLAGAGGYHWHLMLASAPDVGRTYLAKTVVPLVAGVWLFIGGVYWMGAS